MFRGLRQKLTLWQASKQQFENRRLWQEVKRLQDQRIQRDRQVEHLKKETAWLERRLEVAMVELNAKGITIFRPEN